MYAHQTPQKVSMHPDSRTVAMEVGIRLGVCSSTGLDIYWEMFGVVAHENLCGSRVSEPDNG